MANPPAVRGPTFGEGDGPLDSELVTTKYKPVNQTLTDAGFVDDAHLSFPLQGGQEYVFRFVFFYSTSIANEAYDVALNGPAGLVVLRYGACLNTAAAVRQLQVKTAYDSGLGLTTGFGTTVLMGEIFGYISVPPANSGNLVLRHKIETGAPETGTVYAGSWGEVRRVN